MDDRWIPLVKDNEVVDDLLVNAIVTTLTHEGSPGHLAYMAHSDGTSTRWTEDELSEIGLDPENSRWSSSIMSSFYGLAASAYGLANSCGVDFEKPDFTAGGFGGSTTWHDDLYFRNEFSRCAEGKFVDAAEIGELEPRDPAFNRGPDSYSPPENASLNGVPGESVQDAVEAWGDHPEVDADALETAWDRVPDDRHLHAINVEGLTPWIDEAPSDDIEAVIRDFHDMFADQIRSTAGQYVGHSATKDTLGGN